MFKLTCKVPDEKISNVLHALYGVVKDIRVVPLDDVVEPVPVKEIVKTITNLPVPVKPLTATERFYRELKTLAPKGENFTTTTLKKAGKRVGVKPASASWYIKGLVKDGLIGRARRGSYCWLV